MASMTDTFNKSAGLGFGTDINLFVSALGVVVVLAWFVWTIIGFYEAFGGGMKAKEFAMPLLRALTLTTFLLVIFST